MERTTTRRAALAGVLGAGVAGGLLSPARSIIDGFAPLSGRVWEPARFDRSATVESPHGDAEVRYDDEGVPHVSADTDEGLYFAVGYVQATDRLFQMELQRRLLSGRLSEVVGSGTVEDDVFHREMRFREAAEATADHIRGTAVEEPLEAYTDGVNAAIDGESLSLGFQLLDHEPEEWTIVDSIVVEKLIAWNLTGSFRTLRNAIVEDIFGEEQARQLYPARFDPRETIIRDQHDPPVFGGDLNIDPAADETGADLEAGETETDTAADETGADLGAGETETDTAADETGADPTRKALVDRLSGFDPPGGLGSNSWLVGTELAGGDAPILSNDPHLGLQAPPVWYEMHLDGPEHRVRGVTFPGEPFVVIGENDHGAWGFTNVGADVIDFYEYDVDGDSYRYGDEQREFETETEEIPVSGGSNEQITLKRSVHGPVIEQVRAERAPDTDAVGDALGVAWTGHAATETTLAIYELARSDGAEAAREAAAKFEAPTQNLVYADREGNSWLQIVGRLPVRRIDGEVVRGDRLFDGSAREGEWAGFEPFGRPDAWEAAGVDEAADGEPAFVPFEANPHVDDPEYLATANQLTVDDENLGYYLGVEFGPGYRGERIYELLDEAVESGGDIDLDRLREVGRDVRDGRAAAMVEPLVAAARESDDGDLLDAGDTLEEWDHRMETDSEAALLFDRFLEAYRDELFAEAFDANGLDDDYRPPDGAVQQLPPDSPWFGPRGRAETMRVALGAAIEEIDERGLDSYGDLAHTGRIDHLAELEFLAYPEHPRPGTGVTVMNFVPDSPAGGSWEMQVDLSEGGEYLAVLPGGNSGRYFSDHYDDQIERWAAGEYRSLSRDIEGALAVSFEGGES